MHYQAVYGPDTDGWVVAESPTQQHAVFSPGVIDRFAASAIKRVIVTNTIPATWHEHPWAENVNVLSVAPLLGDAIQRIHTGDSVSALFDRNW